MRNIGVIEYFNIEHQKYVDPDDSQTGYLSMQNGQSVPAKKSIIHISTHRNRSTPANASYPPNMGSRVTVSSASSAVTDKGKVSDELSI